MSGGDNGPVLDTLSRTRTYAQHAGFALAAAEAQRAEGTRVLSAVLEIRAQAAKPELGETAHVLHALAMLHYLGRDLRTVSLRAFAL